MKFSNGVPLIGFLKKRGNSLISKLSSGGGGSLDSDVQAFMTATGIVDPTIQNALNTFVSSLKTNNIWSKMKAIYPFVGGTASTHKWNLKDPRDLDAAFRLSFVGTWTHNANGAKTSASGAYANTFLNPATVYADNNYAFGLKASVNASVNGVFGMGLYNGSSITGIKFNTTTSFASYINNVLDQINVAAGRTQFIQVMSQHAVERRYYANSTEQVLPATTNNRVSLNFFISNLNVNGSPDIVCDHTNAFVYHSTLLTSAEALALNTAVQALQTALGR